MAKKLKGFMLVWAWLLAVVSLLSTIELLGLGLRLAGFGGFSLFEMMGTFGGWTLIVFAVLTLWTGVMNLMRGMK